MSEENNMHQDPNNWKLGIFYFNPKDKRILVPKKIQWLGFTFNFGNPYSALIIAVLVILTVLLGKK